ncbi:MAG: hypothetical protein CVU11_16275 [Bacteroidetes bacterium HGW-Bacteroidetes-6]|nr:MAG: hypothetical protein CVU11_16275 [Bacteroidetes bacterium HGW-Bacteroidetes-6]
MIKRRKNYTVHFRIIAVIMLWLFAVSSNYAQKYTFSGTISDSLSGEQLIGCAVQIDNNLSVGTTSNEYGFFSLSLNAGSYVFRISYIGYKSKTITVDLTRDVNAPIRLSPSSYGINEVVISATRDDENLQTPQTGVSQINIKNVKSIPVVFGESDVLKIMQMQPGIKSMGEGSSLLTIRGGAGDQNLILLDEAPVYNASHLLGFFSTFNSDAIKDATVYKGLMPARYGGRLSSVVDVKMNDGNSNNTRISGGIGLISSRINIETPIDSGNGSVLLSARRTYADAFLPLSGDESIRNNTLYFYDLNLKANYRISEKDRLFLSGYFGKDVLGLGDSYGLDWGNSTGTMRWNRIWNTKLFSNTSFIFSNYEYTVDLNLPSNDISLFSRIRDYNLKQHYQWYASTNHTFNFGWNLIHHTVIPGQVTAGDESNVESFSMQNRYSIESGIYAEDEVKLFPRLTLLAGLRLSGFNVFGEGNYYTLDGQYNIVDTVSYGRNEQVCSYYFPEPRAGVSWMLNESSSLKASYTRTAQYIHLLSSATSSNPTDKWVMTNNNIKPSTAGQLSVGYFRNFAKNRLEFSAETYYKEMNNITEYKDGADIRISDAVETQLLSGIGRAYGLELMLNKKTGRFSGWIAYTLSRTEMQIDGINNNNWYPARYDRTHDFSLVVMYKPSGKWEYSLAWVYNTGNAISFPSGQYSIDGSMVLYYTERNGYRMPDYHRLDLGAVYHPQPKKSKRWKSEWTFGVYNAYGRENAYSISFRDSETQPGTLEAVQTSLFRWVPSVSYNFSF